MIGKRFGRLVVKTLKESTSYVQDNGRKQSLRYFECECDCGNIKTIRQSDLYSIKSCGCLRIEENKSRTLDLSGQIFSRLTATYKEDITGNWHCICECGNSLFVKTSNLKNGNTKSCGCLQKEKASKSMTDVLQQYRESTGNNPNVPMSSDYKINRVYFREIAKEVYKRDSHTCAWCSQTGCKVNAHHVETWATSPAKRFDKRNLVTLCELCHLTVHNGNYLTIPNPIMSILLQGYVDLIEESQLATGIELTPN